MSLVFVNPIVRVWVAVVLFETDNVTDEVEATFVQFVLTLTS